MSMNSIDSVAISIATIKEMERTKEPLLQESKNRYVMFPVEFPDIFKMYKTASSSYWVSEEINFEQDLTDLDSLSEAEKFFIFHVLAFFAASDGIVMENLSMHFSNEIPKPEVRAFYAFQNAMEAVHSETYSLLIDTYCRQDDAKKSELFNAVKEFPAIQEKADWALQWISNEKAPFAQRLIGFAIVEGLFFSASFCAIFWLRKRGLLPGLTFANQLISRDEALHTDFACLLYSMIENKLPEEAVHNMFRDAVEIEKSFITESISCAMIGMNTALMIEYIQYVADRLLVTLGYSKLYNAKNPFDFMEIAAAHSVENFFEVRVSSYQKACVNTDVDKFGKSGAPSEVKVDIDADF